MFDELVGKKLNRDGIVLALGGGVVGDVAGFAAACYQRGIGYVLAEGGIPRRFRAPFFTDEDIAVLAHRAEVLRSGR